MLCYSNGTDNNTFSKTLNAVTTNNASKLRSKKSHFLLEQVTHSVFGRQKNKQ